MKKIFLTTCFCAFLSSFSMVCAQEHIDRIVQDWEKEGRIPISTVIRRDSKTKELLYVVKSFKFYSIKHTANNGYKRLMDAFEQDSQNADEVTTTKNPSDNNSYSSLLVFRKGNKKYSYSLTESGSDDHIDVVFSYIMRDVAKDKNTIWMNNKPYRTGDDDSYVIPVDTMDIQKALRMSEIAFADADQYIKDGSYFPDLNQYSSIFNDSKEEVSKIINDAMNKARESMNDNVDISSTINKNRDSEK